MSFRVALTGLDAASADLNITADNIANVNTPGFKLSRAEFADTVVASSGAVARNTIGDGVQTVAVTQQFNQGNITLTGSGLDLAISGGGFFRLNDGGSTLYTRAGAFGTDKDGFIVNPLKQRLTGYGADIAGNIIEGVVTDLQVTNTGGRPNATTSIELSANLDARETVPVLAFDPGEPSSYNHTATISVFDERGHNLPATMFFRKTGTDTWDTYVDVNGTLVLGTAGGAGSALTFNANGSLNTPAGGAVTIPAFSPGTGASDLAITLDYSNVTLFGSQFGVTQLSQDGFSNGQLTGVSIEDNGIVFGRYSNGQSQALGQVILVNFRNNQGLQRVGESSWAESFSSGGVQVEGEPGFSTLGLVQSGSLEDSNVELTEELVNLINAQRNFQANAQVISASDQLTQTILNIG